jgi:tRNA modification GTPase
METAETICAISTPPGEGGIGIIRMSGQLAHSILKKIFKTKKKKSTFISHKLYLGHIINPESKKKIDEVFAVFMHAPHTYTREDIAEVHSHGGLATQKNILSLMMQHGARLAEPGEFTKRAFLNGRIDLLQAESVLDIIQSETDEELKYAIDYLSGTLSQKIKGFKEQIKRIIVEIEALIDFPEEDIEVNEEEHFLTLNRTKQKIEGLIDSYYEGRAIKQGLEALIIGRTNVGKSSLLNALLLNEKAIVTPLPGTTRDMVEDTIHIKGIKLKIIDTAGLRKPKDIVEKEGIERVHRKIPGVDLIVWVLDGSEKYAAEDKKIYRNIEDKNKVVVINKIDLPQVLERKILQSRGLKWIETSALKDIGLDTLKDTIYEQLMRKGIKSNKTVITNLRHRDALIKTKDALERAIMCKEKDESLEFLAFELHEALFYLGEITGETCPEEILHEIFERFCIGK